MATGEADVRAGAESVVIGDQHGAEDTHIGTTDNIDQLSFFRAAQEGNVSSLNLLLKNRKKIDVNAYNSEGATALLLAVFGYEIGRNVQVVTTLLKYGADISVKAAPPPSSHKISIVRHDLKHTAGMVPETKKIVFDHKTPLLIALELKSSLYLKGWEYRHWDILLHILAEATIEHYAAKDLKVPSLNPLAISEVVQHNWDAVYRSGKHELVELVAEGKDIVALKLLVTGASKILRMNLAETNRTEIHDASYNLTKAMVHFLYAGHLDPGFIQHRGIDLFVTANKYGVQALKRLLESTIIPTQENWIKLLTAAVESNSDVLTLKAAQSIKDVLDERKSGHGIIKKSFSDVDGSPHQFYHHLEDFKEEKGDPMKSSEESLCSSQKVDGI